MEVILITLIIIVINCLFLPFPLIGSSNSSKRRQERKKKDPARTVPLYPDIGVVYAGEQKSTANITNTTNKFEQGISTK